MRSIETPFPPVVGVESVKKALSIVAEAFDNTLDFAASRAATVSLAIFAKVPVRTPRCFSCCTALSNANSFLFSSNTHTAP